METPLCVLLIEDSESDAALIVRQLKKAGYAVTVERVETAAQMTAALERQAWDCVIADYQLPQFNAPAALTVLQATGLDLPFIVVSGTIGEETAVALMKAGAHDYLMKDKLARLAPAVRRELAEAQVRRARQQAEEALRASEERFRALVENSADIIAMLTGEGHILYESPAVKRVLGYQPGEMVGHNGFEFLHPGDYAVSQELFGRLLQPQHTPVTTEIRYRRKDDTWAWVQATGTNLLAEPSVQAVVINYQDITERKRADQELRTRNRELSALYALSSQATQSLTFEQALETALTTTLAALDVEAGGIYLWEPGASILKLRAHRGLDEIRTEVGEIHPGLSLPGGVIDAQDLIVFNLDDYPIDQLPSHVKHSGFRSMVTVPLISGGVTLGALIASTRRDHAFPPADLKMLAAIGRQLGGDIQANRTRELAAANERLQELDRLKSKFVSDVSHELRTPITALSLNVDLLEHGKPEKREEYLQAIRQQVKREVQLLEDILSLSRLELGADKVRFAPVVLNALITQVVAVHQPAADAKNLTLTFTPDSDLPVVPGEENQLAQVITNLIGNAINYTPAGEVQINTGLRNHDVVIEVCDTGVGIAPEDVPHLFERFYRGSRTRDIRGTGLGLAIAKEIVDLHDGRIEVNSEAGGTTFRVHLPLAPRPPTVGKSNESTSRPPSP